MCILRLYLLNASWMWPSLDWLSDLCSKRLDAGNVTNRESKREYYTDALVISSFSGGLSIKYLRAPILYLVQIVWVGLSDVARKINNCSLYVNRMRWRVFSVHIDTAEHIQVPRLEFDLEDIDGAVDSFPPDEMIECPESNIA